ncbi:MAG: hypothetical protein ABIJ09_07150 [Pseudomonadota bacterium]
MRRAAVSSGLVLAALASLAARMPIEVPLIAGPEVSADPDVVPVIPGPATQPSLDQPAPAGGMRILADHVRYQHGSQVVFIEGNVEVHQPPFVVLADELRVDFARHRIDALGRVRVIERNRLITCREAKVQMPLGQASLRDVHFEIRSTDVPVQQARDLQAMGRSWPGALWLFGQASEVRREASGALVLKDATVTPCDCGDDAPSWRLTSSHIDVITDHGAWARWPVIYIGDIPVLTLPAWYVPLSDRQSGLLAPRFALRDGFWWMQPAYLTLGRSADLTVTPGVVLQRGPRLELELRWAPVRGSDGQVQLAGQWDEKYLAAQHVDRSTWWGGSTDTGEFVPATRGALRLFHRSSGSDQAAVVDVRVTSDRHVAGDFGDSLGARIEPYVRSAAQISKRLGSEVVVGAQAAAYQDLRQQQLLFFPLPGETPYRAPLLFSRLLPVGLGPVVIEGDADLLRAGLVGAGPASPLDPQVLHEAWRAAAWGRASIPVRLFEVVSLSAGAGTRQALFLDDSGQARTGGVALLDARLSTELHQVYDLGQLLENLPGADLVPGTGADRARTYTTLTLRHGIEPYVRYVGVPVRFEDGRGPWPVVDERDRFRPTHQLLAGVRTTLQQTRARRGQHLAELTLAQGLDARRLAEALALTGQGTPDKPVERLRLGLSDAYLAGVVRYRGLASRLFVAVDPETARVGALLSRIRIAFPKSLTLALSYDLLGSVPTDQLYAANHELFGDTAIPLPEVPLADRLAASCAISPLPSTRLSYGVELAMLAGRQGEIFDRVLTHGGEIVYRSSCQCWEAGARVRFWPDRALPDVGFILTISGFGEQISLF